MSTATALHIESIATLGEFSLVQARGDATCDEWTASLADRTDVVVADVDGAPSELGIEKAIAVVENRAYLEARARRLLTCLRRDDGRWELRTIDFGTAARHRRCEFLMRFAFGDGSVDRLGAADVAFALSRANRARGPIFVLTIATVSGFERAGGSERAGGAGPDPGVAVRRDQALSNTA